MAVACVRISDEEHAARWDVDGDGVLRPDDCDDGDAEVGSGSFSYADVDGDGHGDPKIPHASCTIEDGFADTADDCDDADPAVHPGSAEVCSGIDEDCD